MTRWRRSPSGSGQRLGSRRVPRLPLARREVLVERGAHDGMDEPAARSPGRRCRRPRRVPSAAVVAALLAEPRHLTGELPARCRRPSAATALASSVAGAPERGKPMQDEAATAAGPTAWMSPAAAADGSIPAASRAVSGLRRNNGLQPVAVWHARQNVSAASAPRRSRVSAIAADWLSRRGYSTTAEAGRSRLPPHRPRARPPVGVRRAASRPAGPRCAAPGRRGSAGSPDRPSGSHRQGPAAGPVGEVDHSQ